MKRILHTALLVFILASVSCSRPMEEPLPVEKDLPIGVPTMLTIPFGSDDLMEVEVGTKADAGFINESNIHDLYVFLFDKGDLSTGSPRKIYGRYFNFDHKRASLAELNSHNNECWFVENKSINSPDTPTRGAVKISTVTRSDVTLVVLANVANSVMEMDSEDEITRLNEIEDFAELQGMTVSLEQDIVNRKNLFLMMGVLGYNDGRTISTGSMHWNRPAPNDLQYDPDYKVQLRTLNAKVKFRIKVNPDYISAVTPVYWQVCRTPNSCHLFPDYNGGKAPENIYYFDSQKSYFENTETDGEDTYYTFCFYMLENRLTPTKQATNYYQRELQTKIVSPDEGYEGPASTVYGTHFVDNGDWEYANPNSTYVKFDIILTLTPAGITNLGADNPTGMTIGHALTSDAIFTVHLGDFTSSGLPDGSAGFNNYNTERGHSYTYTVTVNNTRSIFTEVVNDNEQQAGQEGFLLLTDSEIINADAHYDYHSIEFKYRPDMTQEKFAWYVKTPFGEGGPTIVKDAITGEFDYKLEKPLDYLWVKFSVNGKDENGAYFKKRLAYPGENCYDPSWDPKSGEPVPELMDITQLIKYIFNETAKHKAGQPSDFSADAEGQTPVIRVTAFIEEYYYEKDPTDENAQTDPDLWRKFVNAQPRELHILSDARSSRDRKSDVIQSSHSVIQQSIQTIYNVGAANIRTLWGCEHIDEMREKSGGWPYWPGGEETYISGRAGANTTLGDENGRLNSAWIWELFSSQNESGHDVTDKRWDSYLDYNVENERPELDENHHGMAYSCLTRNRDNNGNGIIDRNEVRWYLAAHRQLLGMWVGEFALSLSARLYHPYPGQWRHHVISSSNRMTSWAEEGGNATQYSWDFDGTVKNNWDKNIMKAAVGQSVRCVRNIGTYQDGGELKDISYSPYTQEIDRYFKIEENTDGSYTFYFDNLNPISLRELCETELPYHDQNNISNCLYLKLEAQSPSISVGDSEDDRFGPISLKNINEDVTNKGYNPYCPPGYRFPNQSEALLMYTYLPRTYFTKDKNEEDYPQGSSNNCIHMPTRTYFDRGMVGRVTTNMVESEIAQEQVKSGWAYSTKDFKLHADNSAITHTRCVRDINMTGYIDGSISLPSPEMYPNDWQNVKLNFFSSASAFVYASLKLCYTNHNGDYFERDIPVKTLPSGLQYNAEQAVDIPTLDVLGLTEDDLETDKKNMKLKIELRNASGTVSTFDEPFVLKKTHIKDCLVEFPSEVDSEKGVPVLVKVIMANNRAKLTDVVLHWKKGDGSWQEKPLLSSDHSGSFSRKVYIPDLIGNADWTQEANRTAEYSYYVTASCNDNTSFTTPSKIYSNQLLRLNYSPNPVPAGGWTNNSQCNKTWKDEVSGLSFANGDFIEVDMDLSNCVYVYFDGNPDHDMGKDNIIGFSTDNLNAITNSFIWYYPSVTNLVAPPGDVGRIFSRIHAGKWAAKEITGPMDNLNIILDKDGIKYDGKDFTLNPGDWTSRVKASLTSANKIYVGSVEGIHHSRATYRFVRVVRVKNL